MCCGTSSPESPSPRSVSWRPKGWWSRGARRRATASSVRRMWSGSLSSSACSVTTTRHSRSSWGDWRPRKRGERPQLPAASPGARPHELLEPGAQELPERPTVARVGRAELLASAQVSEAELADWESYGLIAHDADGGYDVEAVTVARLIAELGRFGLEPRH